MYKASDKISDLMSQEEDAIQIISRFGLEMGVGEQTIQEACETHDVHTPTFLAVVNYKVFKQRALPADIDIPTLQRYLHNAHTYFLDFRLPRLRRSLIEAIIPVDPTTKIPSLILRCYDEFVEEIRTHIEHENEGLFEEHEHDDERITSKLTEIKNLIIKYFPSSSTPSSGTWGTITYPLISVMSDLWHTEQDFADHCAIEDDILRPALTHHPIRKAKTDTVKQETEELSDRELDVRTVVDLGEVTETVLSQLSDEIEKSGLRLRTDLREARVTGDPVLLERLVSNLVENALRYNVPNGEITVRSGINEGAPAIQVENSGPVVPAYEIEGLFEPFRRGAGHRVSSTKSAGLGLSIVRSVVRAHHGTVTVWPRAGGGLVVTVHFPVSNRRSEGESSA